MENKLVAFNIIKNNYIYNKDGIPCLFYWDGDKPIEEYVKENESLKNYVTKIYEDLYFLNVKLIGFIFYEKNDEEIYEKITLNLQDIFPLNIIDNNNIIINKYIVDILGDLYRETFNNEFKFNDFLFKSSIIELCNKIKEKHENNVTIETILFFVKNSLSKKFFLEENNINIIIDYLKNILDIK